MENADDTKNADDTIESWMKTLNQDPVFSEEEWKAYLYNCWLMNKLDWIGEDNPNRVAGAAEWLL